MKTIKWQGGDPTFVDPRIQQKLDDKAAKKAAARAEKEVAVPAEGSADE